MIKFLLPLLVALPVFAKTPAIKLDFTNSYLISDEMTPGSAIKDVKGILYTRVLLPVNETLYIIIDSPGGSVAAMVYIANNLQNLVNTKVICVDCASAAAALFQLIGEERLVGKNTLYMMHEMKITVSANNLNEDVVKNFKMNSDEFNKIFYEKMKMSKKDYDERIKDKDWTVDGEQMKILKLADKIIKIECDEILQNIVMPKACHLLK